MSLVAICPGCGKRSRLDASLAGKKLRCKGCDRVFRVSEASPESAHESDAAREPLAAPADTSWLDDGADGEKAAAPAAPSLRRTRSAPSGGGLSPNLLIGLGAGVAALVALVVGLTVLSGGKGSPARSGKAADEAEAAEAPGLIERVTNAVTGGDPAKEVAGYPELGGLPPPLVPPPALRDVSAHERMYRNMFATVERLYGVLGTIHDLESVKASAPRIQELQEQMKDELLRNPPPFQLTPAENAEVSRRIAPDVRRAMKRMREEAQRISGLPGASAVGARFSAMVEQLAAPAEQALKQAENFKAPSGPEPYVEVYIDLHNADDAVVFQRKLGEDLVGGRGIQSTSQSQGNRHRASFRVWPVDDADEFSQTIPFGKARVKGRRIFVKAESIPAAEVAAAKEAQIKEEEARNAMFKAARPHEEENDPKPPPDADDLTKALFALRSSNSGKRKEGVDRISRMTPKDDRRDEVHKQLATLLDDPDGFLVNSVMKAMVLWRTDDTAPALIKILDRPDFGVRWEAEELLGNLGDPQAAGPLAAHLKEDSIKVEPALRALGSAAEPALIALLRNPDSHTRASACNILRDVGGTEALQTMMTLPADPDLGVQVAARNAMQAIRNRVGPVSTPTQKNNTTKGKNGKPG